MPTRRRYLAGLVSVAGTTTAAGCGFVGESGSESGGDGSGGDGGGSDGLPTVRENGDRTDRGTDDGTPLAFSTPAFADGGSIPAEYTGTGADRSPPLRIESVPEAAETLALVVDDPDAGEFVHWLLWNVPAEVTEIPAGLPQAETLPSLDDARQGTNDFGELGYRGPLPPAGDGPHTYRFTLFAVSTTLDLAPGSERDGLADALEGRTVGRHRITGEFER